MTTTATVLFAPYLTSVATAAACPDLADGARCAATLSVLGIPVSPGSLVAYTATVSTIISAIFLIFVGAIADRSSHPTKLFGGFAWVGAIAASLMFLVTGTNWQLGVVLFIIANICLGSSLVIYDSLLVRIAGPNDRDRVSSKGWAFGYLGGGLLLALNFALDMFGPNLGLDRGTTTRISLLSAGLWWGLFALIDPGAASCPRQRRGGRSFGWSRQGPRAAAAHLRRADDQLPADQVVPAGLSLL